MIRTRSRPLNTLLILTLFTLLFTSLALAQTSTATLKGKIVDPEGDPVAGAEVNAVNQATGNVYQAASGRDGSYMLAGLRPGTYDVIVASPAYEPKAQTVQVLIGQSINANFNMSPSVVVSEEITVIGEQVVEMQTATVATNVTTRQIETLPQNSRNFLNFAALAPGIVMSDPDYRKEFRSGAQSAEAVNVFIDGISYKNDILAGGIVGQDASRGNPFPQGAVQEFRVLTQNYSAEFQKASSAVITAVTKSGTNTVTGEVFAFFQDDALVDDNPISSVAEETFERLQSGISLGGPVIRDRLHYFLSYEGNDQDRETAVVMGSQAGNAPAELRQRLAQHEGLYPIEFDALLLFGKGTYQPSSSQIFDLSAFIRSESNIASVGGTNSWENREDVQNDVQNYGLRHQFTTASWFNEASIDFQEYVWNPTPLQINDVGQLYEGILKIGGRDTEQDKSQARLSFRDDLTFSPIPWGGTHSFKIGTNIDLTEYDLAGYTFGNPRFGFRSRENWAFPYRVEYGFGDPQTGADNTVIGLYAQDEWAPTDKLLFNIGIRYDYESDMFPTDWVTPANIRNDLAPYVDTQAYFTDGNDRSAIDDMIAPRLGVTYNLFESDRSVVFGGWGRYFDRTLRGVSDAEKARQTWQRGVLYFSENGEPVDGNLAVAWQDEYLDKDRLFQLLEQGNLNRPEVFLIENDTEAPYADQWTIGLRQRLGDYVASVSYANTQSYNGFTWGWSQVAWDTIPNAAGRCCAWAPVNALGYSNIITSRDDKRTWYEAIYLTVDKPFTADSFWSGSLSYTGALTSEGIGGDNFSFDFKTIEEYPRKPLLDNQEHYLVSSLIFRLPANFTVGSVLTYGSGRRFNIFDQTAGTGPLQRTLWGEGEGNPYTTIDLRLQYDINVAGVSVGLVGEAFNITNDEVESSWQAVIPPLPNTNPLFGQATQVVDNSQRRFQYGVRIRY